MAERILLRVEEAAHAIGCSRSLVYRLIAQGELRTVRIGKAKRVPLAALEEWVKAQEQSEPSGATG